MLVKSDTQQMMAEMAGRLLAKENEMEARRHRLSGDQPARMHLWPHLTEQGLIGALAPEELGGFGGSTRDVGVLMALAGEWLVVEPLLHTALVAKAFALANARGCPVEEKLTASLVSGEMSFAFAHQEGADPFAARQTHAVRQGDAYRLSGTKAVIRHADLVDHLLVTAQLDGKPALFLVEARSTGVTLNPLRLIDASSAADVVLNDAPAQLVLDDAAAELNVLLALYLAGLSAEIAGVAAAVNSRTFAYLVTRKQFGVALSTFQALQHRAADMHIAAEEVRIFAGHVVDEIDATASAALSKAAALKAMADDAGRRIAHESVQLHGGMGVSDELDISHYFRRLAAIRGELAGSSVLRSFVDDVGSPIATVADDDEALARFRRDVRDFVQASLPDDIAGKGRESLEIVKDDYVRWQKILREKGWFAANWPSEFGGNDWDIRRQLTMLQESALNNAPMIIPYGVSMVGPVIYSFGNKAQQERHLPGILSNDVWWCQGYSEPNSGSDLASLKTTAVRDGDHYVVNGTKMWTTEAHWADWMHCLVRTNKDVKAQAGISFLLIDMTSPGIEIRPIVTIDGQHHTNQVFLDNVRVPAENLVGEEGQGWTIAKFLLSNERVAIADTGPKMRLLVHIRGMFEAACANGELTGARRTLIADMLVSVETELAALLAMEEHYVGYWAAGEAKTGPEASILKIRGTEILQRLSEVALAIEGPLGAVHDPRDLHLPGASKPTPAQSASAMAHQYLYGRCWSIFGGTNEIQRNIIAGTILR
ncbi:acyl-CoA dehydrogenase family protein [Rhizorhabdus argentea]|uniref:acyl-CoA dehydrogenase family protein n=1 Tax=Rhizorhabdus argentea TaxID=1387174 RepID=UPI0030EB2892